MGKKGHEAEVQWCDPRDGRTMAIAVAKGKRRKSPAGLASHCEFVLSRIGGGASLKGRSGYCMWEGKSAKNILVRGVSGEETLASLMPVRLVDRLAMRRRWRRKGPD